MAALAYGAVYGAEPEYADRHPELALLDDTGERISLAELFYIMNIAPDSPWTSLIVAEFAETVRTLDFDGIHLDQYGFPKTATTATGERVDLADHFPPLIDRSRAAVVAVKPDAGVIFNAVGNWPIETVAPTTQDAVYIEVWPPDEDYADLVRLIHDAKRLSNGKAVILAAYLSPFLDADSATLPEAETAVLLATAVISAAGGSHLLLGEHNGILCDPYYPKYSTVRSSFVPTIQTYYDTIVRYGDWFIGSDVTPDEITQVALSGVPLSRTPTPGHVWAIVTRKPGYLMVHLINVTDQSNTAWNALRTPVQTMNDLTLTIASQDYLQRAHLISPDHGHSHPTTIEGRHESGIWTLNIPSLTVWSILIFTLDDERA
jgi:dextranase